jgi:hypothetical protein
MQSIQEFAKEYINKPDVKAYMGTEHEYTAKLVKVRGQTATIYDIDADKIKRVSLKNITPVS